MIKLIVFDLDGVLVDTKIITFSLANSTQPLLFGSEAYNLGRFFNGRLDDIGVWSRPLTSSRGTFWSQSFIRRKLGLCPRDSCIHQTSGHDWTAQPFSSENNSVTSAMGRFHHCALGRWSAI